VLLVCTGIARAGRPLTVDDAEPVAAWGVEFEAGVGYVGDGPLRHWDFPLGVTFGLGSGLELGVGSGGQLEERGELASGENLVSGIRDVILAGKWKFANQTRHLPAQALALSVKLPTASYERGLGSGEVDYDVTWIGSQRLSEKWRVHVNAGYSWLGDPESGELADTIHYGIAAGWQISKHVEAVAELYANTPLDGLDTTAFVNFGARWQILAGLTLDAAAGAGLTSDSPEFISTLGITWAFDLRK